MKMREKQELQLRKDFLREQMWAANPSQLNIEASTQFLRNAERSLDKLFTQPKLNTSSEKRKEESSTISLDPNEHHH